jgi:hypothetical protein
VPQALPEHVAPLAVQFTLELSLVTAFTAVDWVMVRPAFRGVTVTVGGGGSVIVKLADAVALCVEPGASA